MKVSLVVIQGAYKGKEIPITHSEFLIGRDSDCHLRPANTLVSRRHCAVLIRGGKVLVRDYASTNGTFVNDTKVDGEMEVHNWDQIKLDPLVFIVHIDQPASTNTTAPAPSFSAETTDPESSAALLLGAEEEEQLELQAIQEEDDDIPMGTTAMDIPILPEPEPFATISKPRRGDPANPSHAAKALLEMYSKKKKKDKSKK